MKFSDCVPILVGVLVMSPASAEVELTPEERDNLGIEVEAAQPIDTARTLRASATVIDATALITTLGDLRSAEAAALASRAELERSEQLYKEDANVARKALDAVRAQSMTDAAHVTTVRAQLMGAWGHGVAALAPAAREALVEDLLAGHVSLARADLAAARSASLIHPAVQVSTVDNRNHWSASWLGSLPQPANATFTGAELLKVPAALVAGQPLEAAISESAKSIKGLSAPVDAVIRWRGHEWYYAETSANHFERLEVKGGTRIEGRIVIAESAAAAPKVVTTGARALLGAELGASEPHESESEDDGR